MRVGPFEFPGLVQPEGCPDEIAEFPCVGGTATFRTRFPVRCPDAETYVFDATVTAVCLPCPLAELDALRPLAPEAGELSDDATTSTTASDLSTSDAPTTTTPRPETVASPPGTTSP